MYDQIHILCIFIFYLYKCHFYNFKGTFKCYLCKCYRSYMLPPINVKVITPHKCYRFPCSEVLRKINGGLYMYVSHYQQSIPKQLSCIGERDMQIYHCHRFTFFRVTHDNGPRLICLKCFQGISPLPMIWQKQGNFKVAQLGGWGGS